MNNSSMAASLFLHSPSGVFAFKGVERSLVERLISSVRDHAPTIHTQHDLVCAILSIQESCAAEQQAFLTLGMILSFDCVIEDPTYIVRNVDPRGALGITPPDESDGEDWYSQSLDRQGIRILPVVN